ncbi:hypothetical protein DWV39_10885 [Bifidobacterium longum]|nr:hypothetical protein DWV39_10885 [Bifidobacterium longum]RGX00299.1 hypothetical protein DWV38_10875 [Bifidobacterium longum]
MTPVNVWAWMLLGVAVRPTIPASMRRTGLDRSGAWTRVWSCPLQTGLFWLAGHPCGWSLHVSRHHGAAWFAFRWENAHPVCA